MSHATVAPRSVEPSREASAPLMPLARPPASGTPIDRTLIERHAVLAYYALAFAISWGGVALAVGPLGVSGSPVELLLALFLPMAAGPTAAGLVLTGVLDGRATATCWPASAAGASPRAGTPSPCCSTPWRSCSCWAPCG